MNSSPTKKNRKFPSNSVLFHFVFFSAHDKTETLGSSNGDWNRSPGLFSSHKQQQTLPAFASPSSSSFLNDTKANSSQTMDLVNTQTTTSSSSSALDFGFNEDDWKDDFSLTPPSLSSPSISQQLPIAKSHFPSAPQVQHIPSFNSTTIQTTFQNTFLLLEQQQHIQQSTKSSSFGQLNGGTSTMRDELQESIQKLRQQNPNLQQQQSTSTKQSEFDEQFIQVKNFLKVKLEVCLLMQFVFFRAFNNFGRKHRMQLLQQLLLLFLLQFVQ